MRATAWAITLLLTAACSSPPPPKPPPPPEPPQKVEVAAPEPVMQQELGSIDDGAIEQSFVKLGPQLETCHAAGRARIGVLAGDVTVFMRIDAHGQARYDYLQSSTLGDRETEKCILDLLTQTTWPVPVGGEAEVTHSFGWEAGSERALTSWDTEKITDAIDASAVTKHALDQCKRGANAMQLTAYVSAGAPAPSVIAPTKKKGKQKSRKKTGKSKGVKPGHFREIGAASSNKDVAEKIDCVISALKDLPLPSPGSYTAKVSFTL
ncbi:MAG: hypothetical protein ABI421_04865 [Polyangiaceae bacterium]